MTTDNFMTEEFAESIYERYCRFIYTSQIPAVYDSYNNPVKGKTLLVCYEEIGSTLYVNLRHLYTEDDETFKLTVFLINRHSGKVQDRNKSISFSINERINMNELLRNSKVSLINSSKSMINYIKNNMDILNSENITHPSDDIAFKRKGNNKAFSFYTETMYNSKLSNEPRFY
ncbi:hypothetical protein PBI_SCTP2_331 [Salicola phage SCTP-2]|nr:hypothetical protein PBI_SCTP2_331 [Salicola phage SCTP-2]